MTFPLAQGTCRRVCRPVRDPPRKVGIADVVRFAKAAVRHGNDPFTVANAVRRALGTCCDDAINSLDNGIQALQEDWDRILEVLEGLSELLGIIIPVSPGKWRHVPLPGKAVYNEGWWRRLIKKLIMPLRLGLIIAGLMQLFWAIEQLLTDLDIFIEDVLNLIRCVVCDDESESKS